MSKKGQIIWDTEGIQMPSLKDFLDANTAILNGMSTEPHVQLKPWKPLHSIAQSIQPVEVAMIGGANSIGVFGKSVASDSFHCFLSEHTTLAKSWEEARAQEDLAESTGYKPPAISYSILEMTATQYGFMHNITTLTKELSKPNPFNHVTDAHRALYLQTKFLNSVNAKKVSNSPTTYRLP